MKPIIEVKNISKQYKIGQKQRYLSLRDTVSDFFSPKSQNIEKSEFRALDDVSFDIYPGESIGIIGRNGAGKSTLLKILSRITPPTKGKVILRGRIASLLEVGTGFHSELSGRENVFMNGSILGLRRAEIAQKFDEIVAFSGVEQFIDTSLKHYSSGMQLRLAFAVAAHLEPEILVIDEVLAVGDAEFQKKCLGKMDDVSKSGRTVLFVSHNIEQIKRLCPTALLLENGKKTAFGETHKTLDIYLSKQDNNSTEWIKKDAVLENPYFSISRMKLTDISGHPISENISLSTTEIWLEIEGNIETESNLLCIGFVLRNAESIPLFMSYQTDGNEKDWQFLKKGSHRIRAKIDISQLNEGHYQIEFISTLHCIRMLHTEESGIAVHFTIHGLRAHSLYYTKRRNFLLNPEILWEKV
jgi:lipopolysaccharide transport system ATP-binding protein